MEENENQAVGSKNIPKKQPKKSGNLKNVIALVLVALICTGFGFFLGGIALENKEEAVNTTANTTESNTGSNSGNSSESNSETSKDNTNACEHVIVKIDETPATCEKDGLTEGQKCSLCGEILVQQNKIPAAHTPSAEPTCTAAQKCTACNVELKPALGHTAGAEATCVTAQKCTACNAELKAALGHTPGEWETLKEPTTTENGQKVKKCTVCGEKADEQLIPAIGNLNLSFESFGNGTCYVSGIGGCTATEIVIPSTYNGMTVTTIGDRAFENCTDLTSVVIPDTVTRIRRLAFKGCSGLTSMVIPDSVTVIDEEAFYNCNGLKNILLSNNLTSIEYQVFYSCSALTSVTIPDSVTSIGDSAFEYCAGLTSVTIGNGVTSIGGYAFSRCDSLTNILIPNNVTSIGQEAFSSCAKLRTVVIGSGVTSIGGWAFYNDDDLTSIYYNGTTEQWKSISKGSLWDRDIPAAKVICSDGEVALL